MAKINTESIMVKVAQDSSGKLKALAQSRAQVVFNDAVEGMKIEFENHSVTREIEGGIESKNISDTLRGGSEPENLFSFIGFKAGSEPLAPIRDLLDPENPKGPKLKYVGKTAGKNVSFNFVVSTPNKETMAKRTPIPWATGLSWMEGIENGIAGFARFLPTFNRPNSHSGGGVQASKNLRGADYNPPSEGYMTVILDNFLARIKNYAKAGFRKRF